MEDRVVASRRLAELATVVIPIPCSTPVPEVEELLRADPTLPGVAVRTRDGEAHLIGRAMMDAQLMGRLGYGRLLLARRPIEVLIPEATLRLDADTDVESAAQLALDRSEGSRADDVLVTWPDGTVGIVEIDRLMTQLAGRYADLAHRDPLTHLGNRRALEAAAAQALAEQHELVALFLLDLDRFKEINDGRGHDAGDEVLCHVSDALRQAELGNATLVRSGGDEFIVVVNDFTKMFPAEVEERPVAERLLWLGQQLRRAVHGPFTVAGEQTGIDASVGVAYAPDHGRDLSSLLRRADAAMYAAKRSGTAVRVWHDDITLPHGGSLRNRT